MFRLSLVIFLLLNLINFAQKSPHGKNLSLDCENCHSQNTWKVNIQEIKFDHNKTKFELIGQHKRVDCRKCHVELKFENTKSDCFDCHKDIHKTSVGFDCKRCHSTFSWLIEDINIIHNNSRFPLVGNHKNLNCQRCHKSFALLSFEVIDIECYSCHKKDYESASNPNHLLAGFPRICNDCHNIYDKNWGGGFSHDFFPLIGGHSIKNCSSCHNNNIFSQLNRRCESCHLADYNRTQNPNHLRLVISTDCSLCHSTNLGWKPAIFPDHNNYFALTGKHNQIRNNCFDCHKGNYISTPRECVGCHLNNYNQTSNPNHSVLQFPYECETCHNTNSWIPSTFNHDQLYFPIYSGKHRNTWSDCRTCHTNKSNYSIFSCLNCHEHRRERMDDKHRNVSGYVYESNACLSCHPNGTKPSLFISPSESDL